MPLDTWLAFFVASWLISLSPGAGAISCVTAGMRFGYRRALWNIVGLELGIMFILVIVAAGLGVMLAASGTAFAIAKWLGVGYLIWLGIQQWRAPVAPAAPDCTVAVDRTSRALVLRGFLVNATNPKGILFMLAVLPQFIDPTSPQWPQYAICAATLLGTDLVVMSIYTGLATRLLRLSRAPKHQRVVNRAFGGLFVAAGGMLAAFHRAA